MTTYTDPPEVLRLADVLETLPRWYLALMLARALNRKAAQGENTARREAVVVRTHGGGEVVCHAAVLPALG